MANADGTVNYDALSTQDGTEETLYSTLDLATYTGAWTSGTSLPAATLDMVTIMPGGNINFC